MLVADVVESSHVATPEDREEACTVIVAAIFYADVFFLGVVHHVMAGYLLLVFAAVKVQRQPPRSAQTWGGTPANFAVTPSIVQPSIQRADFRVYFSVAGATSSNDGGASSGLVPHCLLGVFPSLNSSVAPWLSVS
jgi:hypothetical protein